MTPEFLDALNTAIDEGVASYRNDRAANPGLSDAEFLHKFGAELVEMVRSNAARIEQVAYTAAAALHRLANLEDGQDGHTRHIVLGTHADIDLWRRRHQLTRRDVIAVTSSYDLRGYGPGAYKLITLASWKPTREMAADVRESLKAMEAHGAVIYR